LSREGSDRVLADGFGRAGERDVIPIAPSRGLLDLRLGELWRYRELLYFLVWRDLKVRYRQTFFGAAWALIQPFLLMVVFSVVLGRFIRVPSNGVPYPLFVYAGLLPWTLFSRALVGASDSLVESSQLISKVYFPRLMLPVSAAASYLVDLAVAMTLFVGMMLYYGVRPGWTGVTVPVFAVAALLGALAVGIWLAAINVKYRDVRLIIPFVVQLWLFATPVAYPVTIFPARWQPLIGLNPVAGAVEGFRWALLGGPAPGAMLAVSFAVCLVILIAGFVFFRRAERVFADWI
jgi:lipopolysaccharide transport system permease protein